MKTARKARAHLPGIKALGAFEWLRGVSQEALGIDRGAGPDGGRRQGGSKVFWVFFSVFGPPH